MNAGEDVLVFYNDNKASFQQFVEMMRNERDRQYQEDMQIAAGLYESTTKTLAQDKQQPIGSDISESTPGIVEATTAEEPAQQEVPLAAPQSEYGENNGYGALRLVCLFIYLFIILDYTYNYNVFLINSSEYIIKPKNH